MSRTIGYGSLFTLLCLAPAPPASSQTVPFAPNLAKVAAGSEGKVDNRGVTQTDKDGQPALRFDERAGDGLVSWPDVMFSDGAIELDVRGKDIRQKSFVGVAFHGSGQAYEAVYFRAFNFRSGDAVARNHAVQYISSPEYGWERLRKEHPGVYENPIAPAPDPNGWIHARIVVAYPKVSVFVNSATEPSLVIEELSGRKTGWVGLWVGNGSGGDFANFKVSAVLLAAKTPSLQSQPIPDREPAVTAHLRAAIQDAMKGAMRQDDYTPEMWKQFSPMQKQLQADLRMNGDLLSLALVDRRMEDGRRSYRYILDFRFARALERFDLDEHGRIAAVRSEGGELKSLDALDAMIQGAVDRGELAGVVTLIVRRGATVRLKTYGMMDIEGRKPMRPDALFRIASMNKLFTAAAALRLCEEGRLALDDPVEKYIPELGKVQVLDSGPSAEQPSARLRTVPAERKITIRDLFRHTAGFLYTLSDSAVDRLYVAAGFRTWHGSLSEFVERLSRFPLAYQPGSKWAYSYSFDVLGRVIEIVSHRPLNEYVKASVFDPLRMSDTDYFVPEAKLDRLTNHYEFANGSLRLAEAATTSPFRHLPAGLSGGGGWGDGYGGVVSTAADIARFLQMLLNYGELDGVRILRRETVAMMTSNQIATIRDRSFPVSGYGLGVGVYTDPARPEHTKSIFWSGGPYNTHCIADYDAQTIGVLLTQTAPFGHLSLMGRFDELFGKLSAQ